MSREEILESFKDLILSLQDKEKTNSASFRDRWLAKKVLLSQEIELLNKADYDWLQSEYSNWGITFDLDDLPK
jgi:hypothetical protein